MIFKFKKKWSNISFLLKINQFKITFKCIFNLYCTYPMLNVLYLSYHNHKGKFSKIIYVKVSVQQCPERTHGKTTIEITPQVDILRMSNHARNVCNFWADPCWPIDSMGACFDVMHFEENTGIFT